jgi:hypothetical protein
MNSERTTSDAEASWRGAYGSRSYRDAVTKCVFCGQAGRSREHILPLAWLEDVMPSTGPYEFVIQRYDHGDTHQKRLQMRKPEFVTRRVCRTCNNGWMNRLDLAAQPLLTQLLTGERFTITRLADVALLASWATKIAIVTDAAQPAEAALAREHGRYLHDHRRPPPGWLIWLAHAQPQTQSAAALNAFTLLRPLGLGYVTTTMVNQLVLQSLVLPAAEPLGTHPFPDHAIELWPPTYLTIPWPHARSLDPMALVGFAGAIAGEPLTADVSPPRVPVRRSGY